VAFDLMQLFNTTTVAYIAGDDT